MFGLSTEHIIQIQTIFQKHPEIELAFIFGSRAMNSYKPASDVDIAIKGEQINRQTILEVSRQLNEETLMPYNFDIVNYHTIQNKELIVHIDKVGVLLFEKKNPS